VKSCGGGGRDVLGVGPSSTMNTAAMPIAKWNSKWQCMNHAPVYVTKKTNHELDLLGVQLWLPKKMHFAFSKVKCSHVYYRK
jgi:hypothetical protein